MKKLTIILTISIVLSVSNVFSQTRKLSNREYKVLKSLNLIETTVIKDTISTNNLSYYTYKYEKQKNLGYKLQALGGLIIAGTSVKRFNGEIKASKDYTKLSEAGKIKYGDSYYNSEAYIINYRQYEIKRDKIDKIKKIGTIAGSSLLLVGTIVQINGFKWLKIAHVSEDGIGVKIPLSK